MRGLDVRSLMMLMLVSTLCLVIVMIVAMWAIIGPERVPETAREHLHELIILLMGMVSGYLVGKGGNNRVNNHAKGP